MNGLEINTEGSMELSFRIVVIALVAMVLALLLIMFISGTSGESSQTFHNITDWIMGISKKP